MANNRFISVFKFFIFNVIGLIMMGSGVVSAKAAVADHTVISQFSGLAKSAVDSAAAKKVLFMHQSTGGYIDDGGLNCLAGLRAGWDGYPAECTTYANNVGGWPWYNRVNWAWDFWPSAQADAIAKTDQFVDVVHARAANYQVIGMKYCYVDGWNQSDNVDQSYYINKMLALESQYPTKTFIWATSALWNDPGSACDASNPFNSCLQIQQFNQQIRTYARAHNKPLYDIADIESHDANGNSCTAAGYEGMCGIWYDSGGGHPNINGAIRLAKSFWWLMANINGTTPTSTSVPIATRTPTPAPTAAKTPTPTLIPSPTSAVIIGDANGDKRVDGLDYVIWLNHYGGSATGAANGDFTGDGKTDGLDYVVWLNHYNP